MEGVAQAIFEGDIEATWGMFRDKTEEDAKAIAEDLFGKDFGPSEAARLVAAPGGSRVFAYVDGSSLSVEANYEGDLYSLLKMAVLLRNFRIERGGLVVEHQYSEVRPRGKRLGPRIFARAVRLYREIDIKRIECRASGSKLSDNSGYIVWPTLGFNLRFNDKQRATVHAARFVANDTHELFLRYPEEGKDNGLDWWADNGSSGDAEFDLSPDSQHSEILDTYLRNRGIEP